MIVHHELRSHMQGYDVEITLQKAHEKYPDTHACVISDNGKQFIAKEYPEDALHVSLSAVNGIDFLLT